MTNYPRRPGDDVIGAALLGAPERLSFSSPAACEGIVEKFKPFRSAMTKERGSFRGTSSRRNSSSKNACYTGRELVGNSGIDLSFLCLFSAQSLKTTTTPVVPLGSLIGAALSSMGTFKPSRQDTVFHGVRPAVFLQDPPHEVGALSRQLIDNGEDDAKSSPAASSASHPVSFRRHGSSGGPCLRRRSI